MFEIDETSGGVSVTDTFNANDLPINEIERRSVRLEPTPLYIFRSARGEFVKSINFILKCQS